MIGSLVTDLVAGPLLGAIPTDKFFVLWALFAFVMLAVAWAAAALQALFGPAGTLIVIVVFVIFGAPAAGGSVPRPFLPSFWGTIGPYLPPGAGTTAVRNTIYFGGNGIGARWSSSPSISSSAGIVSSGPVDALDHRTRRPISRRRALRPSSSERVVSANGPAVVTATLWERRPVPPRPPQLTESLRE